MSYTYLLDAAGESSAECFLDIPACVLSKLSLTAEKFYCNASETKSCPGFQFGTTLEPSTESPGAEKLMSSPADSHARESALRETEPVLTTKKVDCGLSSGESLARYDLATHSLRTHQHSLFEAGCELLETLPRWGMMRDGELFPLPTPSGLTELRASITNALESGSWQRMETPTTQDGCDREPSKNFAVTKTGRFRHLNEHGVESQERLCQQVKRLPTPNSSDNRPRATELSTERRRKMGKQISLEAEVKYPVANSAGRHGTGGLNLQTWVAESGLVPTPTTQDAKNNGSPSQMNRDALNATVGGPLNPEWVEWLMGWPIGWTDLRPLETDKFLQWLRSHGERLLEK